MCSKVVTVTPDDSIFRAMELLVEQRCSGLAVIGENPLFEATFLLCKVYLS